jgi:pyruvate dehydrogenase E2 component (dihydrolipoamide acetyltransferase)
VEFAKPSAVESHPRPADPGRDESPSSPGERAAAADGAPTATPVARKIAQIAGLDLSAVQPSRGSRITKADVEQALGRRQAPPSPAASGAPAIPTRTVPAIDAPSSTDAAAAAAAPFEERSLSAMRRVTAARLQQAKQTIPHFYLHADCRVDALLELRARWNASANAAKITITDALVFLASRALKKVPLANSAWTEGGLRVFSSSDIAVAVNTPAGLITPVIRGADTKNIVAISRELAALAERARAGTLKPAEYSGGTFTISNLGMYGVTSIVPIVNPPQACILGVGAIEARPVVAGDAVVPGRIMTCTLAADHRAIDGATGAEFLSTLRRFIEDPWGVLL